MRECTVCGLLYLGTGACPSCGSQVSVAVSIDEIATEEDSIPGLDDIADAIGPGEGELNKAENLPFGMGAKAEFIGSSLPFGVGSFSNNVTEVAIPLHESYTSDEGNPTEESSAKQSVESTKTKVSDDETSDENTDTHNVSISEETKSNQQKLSSEEITEEARTDFDEMELEDEDDEIFEEEIVEFEPVPEEVVQAPIEKISNDIPDMWKIDAADVDMDAIYAQDEQIIEVSFDDDLSSGDVEVTFDEFHHSPVEESMASDEDAPGLHPAKAMNVDSSGEPEIERMIIASFEHMSNSSWMQAAQILSTVSANRANDPFVLNNLGLALLQSALDMDAKGDPMSASQYEAAIMALRQGAKLEPGNNTLLLNLAHALLVSGRAEKSLGVLNVLRGRLDANVEVENTYGACLIQLGRDEEALNVLTPFSSDSVVAANIALI